MSFFPRYPSLFILKGKPNKDAPVLAVDAQPVTNVVFQYRAWSLFEFQACSHLNAQTNGNLHAWFWAPFSLGC